MSGRVALITGATGGLGLAAATALAQRNADLWIVGRDPQRTEAARQAIIAVAPRGVARFQRDERSRGPRGPRRRAEPRRPRPSVGTAARRVDPQRGRAHARSALHRRWSRGHRAGARRRTVLADDRAASDSAGHTRRPRHHGLVGGHVHPASRSGRARHARDPVQRRARLCQRQAGPGRAQRTLVETPRRVRRRVPRDAPRLGRHARCARVAAALSRADGSAAAHAESGSRHDGVAGDRPARARDERAVLAGPPAAIRRPAAGHPHERRRCRAMLELVRRPRGVAAPLEAVR